MSAKPLKESPPLLASFADDRDIGSRENQEDFALCSPVGTASGPCAEVICALADGMGGHAGGEIASRVAVSAFVRVLKSAHPESGQEYLAMVNAAQTADAALYRRLLSEPEELRSMGCTLCSAWIKNGKLFFLNVGDSLVFLMRDKRLYLLNHRHNHREDMRRRAFYEGLDWGEVSRQESVVRYGARITSYLGGRGIDQADCPAEPIQLQAGDTVLLASDGLLTLSEREIAEALLPAPGRSIHGDAEHILECVLSKKAPKQDNVSVVVIRMA